MAGPAATVKVAAAVVTPPETTVTLAVPAAVRRLAGTAAASCVELTNFVPSAAPFHFTTAEGAKPTPFTASVKPAEPAAARLGTNAPTAGPPATVNVTALEVRTGIRSGGR